MSNGGKRLAGLFTLGDELPDVQSSTRLLTQLLGVKGKQGLRYSPTIVPILESSDLLLQQLSETLQAEVDITAALGNVAGSVYTFFTVPNTETWRILDGAISSDVLDADQSLPGIQPVYSDSPITAGLPLGVLGGSNPLIVSASQIGAQLLLITTFAPWLRPGGVVAFFLRAPAVLGLAAALRVEVRMRIVRLRY